MTLVAHYDLELHQIDVKTTFFNEDLYENVYMTQPKDFVIEGKENLGCHLTKSIYGLKYASRQCNLKFDETIRKFGFNKNDEDNCTYAKFKNKKFIFLVLYVDDILLASSNVHLLLETKISYPHILIWKILVKLPMYWGLRFIGIEEMRY
jgi:hypothetical protein